VRRPSCQRREEEKRAELTKKEEEGKRRRNEAVGVGTLEKSHDTREPAE